MSASPAVPAAPVADASTTRGRYEFLDALRGVAAMAVVVQHAIELLWPRYVVFSLKWFRLGEFGVVLFFLCSGFIIPASLERHGSQPRFWVGRFFRLYPLYWTTLAAVLVLHYGFDRYPLDAAYLEHPVRATAANATMVQDFLGTPLALGQSWSLAYELVFYGVVAALFVGGLHKRSLPLALAGLGAAMVVGTRWIPVRALSHLTLRQGVVLVGGTALAAVLMWRAGAPAGRQRWLGVAVALVAVPLVVHRPENLNTACFFFGTLFAGTAIFRWTAGEISGRALALLGGAAALAIVVMNVTSDIYWLGAGPARDLKQAEITTYLAAYGVFLLAVLGRRREFPRPLIYLGTISYSLYLVHSLAIYGVGHVFDDNRVLTPLVWIAVGVAASAVTYRWVEKPAMDLGHRLGRRAGAARSSPVSSR